MPDIGDTYSLGDTGHWFDSIYVTTINTGAHTIYIGGLPITSNGTNIEFQAGTTIGGVDPGNFSTPSNHDLDMNQNNITNVNNITTNTINSTFITPIIKNSITGLTTKSLFVNDANTIDNYFAQNTQFTFNNNGDIVFYLFPGEAKLYIVDHSLPNPLTNFTTITSSDFAGIYAVSNIVGNPAVGIFIYFLSYAVGSFHKLIKFNLTYGQFQEVELNPANAVWDRTNNLVATSERVNNDEVFLYIGNLNKTTSPPTNLITIYKILVRDGTITPQDINVPNESNVELILTSYIPFVDYQQLMSVNAPGLCLAIKATDNSLSYIALYLWDTITSQYFMYYYSSPKLNTPVNSLLQTYADSNTSNNAKPTGICVAYGDNTIYTYDYMYGQSGSELHPDSIYINLQEEVQGGSILNLTSKTFTYNPYTLPFQKIGTYRRCYSYFTALNSTTNISNVYFINMNPLQIVRGWELTENGINNSISILTYNNRNNCLYGILNTFINFLIDGSSGSTITEQLTITNSLNIASDNNDAINTATTTKNCGLISLSGGVAILYNPLITRESVILINKQTFTNPTGAIGISAKEYGFLMISSTQNNDNDKVGYMICNS